MTKSQVVYVALAAAIVLGILAIRFDSATAWFASGWLLGYLYRLTTKKVSCDGDTAE